MTPDEKRETIKRTGYGIRVVGPDGERGQILEYRESAYGPHAFNREPFVYVYLDEPKDGLNEYFYDPERLGREDDTR